MTRDPRVELLLKWALTWLDYPEPGALEVAKRIRAWLDEQ